MAERERIVGKKLEATWVAISVVAATLASGCGPGAAERGAPTAEAAAKGGLQVGPPIDVARAAGALRPRFRAGAQGLTASGDRHAFAISDGGAVLLRRVPTAIERRKDLVARARDRARVLVGVAAGQRLGVRPATAPAPSAALSFETVSVARSGNECVASGVRASLAADGSAVRAFASCRERWRNRRAGGEVTFEMPSRPAGTGDLVVTVRTKIDGGSAAPVGAALSIRATTDQSGLHLSAPGAGRFLFGHGTWIDAAGRRTPVAARFADGAITLAVPAAVVDASRYPAVLDPTVGPDLGTDGDVLVPASGGFDPGAATDGTNSLVVWEDLERVRAVRVDPAGHVLDSASIDLGQDDIFQFHPSVAFGGGHYLVAWWQDDGTTISVHGRLLNPDGTLVGDASFAISSDESLDDAVAWDGTHFVAAWTSLGDDPGIHVALLGADGSLVAGSERRASVTGNVDGPRVAVGAGTALVAWEDQHASTDFTNRIFAARLARDGAVLDPGGFRLSAVEQSEDHPSIASDGSAYLVVWHRDDVDNNDSIEGAVVNGDGVIVAPEHTLSRSAGPTEVPAAVFDGTQYFVAWQDMSAETPVMRGTLVSKAGVALGDADAQLSALPVQPFTSTGLVWNGSAFLLAFLGNRSTPDNPFAPVGIDGSLIAPDLTVTADALVLNGVPASRESPHAAWNGHDYVVSWTDERGGRQQTTARAVRISAAGEVLDPSGLAVSDPQLAFSQDLASNGDGPSLVVWSTVTGQAFARAVSARGNLRPARSLTPLTVEVSPVIAGNGSNYLAVFGVPSVGGTGTDLVGRFLDADGTPGARVNDIQHGIDCCIENVLALGDQFVVQASAGGAASLLPINGNGRVGTPIPLPGAASPAAAATGDRNSLLVWGGSGGAIMGQLFARGAFRGAPFTIADSSDSFGATVAWDGARYWVVWASDSDTEHPMARSVRGNGTLGDTAALFDGGCESPQLASNGQRQLLLTCFDFEHAFQVIHVSTRLIDTHNTAP